MSSLAIITARGGSKRIPKKNMKEFLGKPIIVYSIQAALSSGIFDEVMVSTDDAEIAKVAESAGAKIPFMRSVETANDYATTQDVLLEVIGQYRDRGRTFDRVCCIYPTAPFVTAEVLREAAEKLQPEEADMVMPVVRFGFPPQRGVVVRDGYMEFKWPEYRLSRSQDLEPFYHDAGQFYFFKTERFLEQQKLVMEHTVPLIRDEMQVQDIDNEDDWKIAEIKYRAQTGL